MLTETELHSKREHKKSLHKGPKKGVDTTGGNGHKPAFNFAYEPLQQKSIMTKFKIVMSKLFTRRKV